MILAILAAVTVTMQPAQPKVGDLIAIQFQAPVTLDASQDYELVSHGRDRVVVRTFVPRPFELSGVAGKVRFKGLEVPVRSVLAPADAMAPAPLVPPRPVPYPRAPFVAIALAALGAIAAWAAVWWRARALVPAFPEIVLPPEERFRRAVLALRANGAQPLRWASLADETRRFLAATRPNLGGDLTTTELVPRLADRDRVVIEILRRGDREKFSPWGTDAADFEEVANRALALAAPREEPPS